MLEEIESLYIEMRDLTLKSGIKPETYSVIASEISEVTPIQVKEQVLGFLRRAKEDWLEIKKIHDLLAPDVWKYYQAMGISGLREQILLDQAMKPLRDKWKKFIKFWKEKKPS